MKRKLFLVLLCCMAVGAPPAIGADPSAAKKPVKRATVSKPATAKPAATHKAAPSGKTVRSQRGRTARAPAAPMVQGQGAATPLPNASATTSNVPKRAYAADGRTFYKDGKKVRIEGLPDDADDKSEMAKQRLQKALDAGEVTLEPKGTDAAGNMLAVVRVNGTNVTDVLKLDELRAAPQP